VAVASSVVGSPFATIRPRKVWFVLPTLLALAGAGTAVWIVLSAWSGPGAQWAVVPGSAELDLGVGHHRIYHEHESVIDGQRIRSPRSLPPLDITLTSAATEEEEEEEEVALDVPSARYSYESDFPTRRAGYSILSFDITTPGRYVLRATGSEQRVVLSIRPAGRIVAVIRAGAVAVVAFALAIGIAIAIDVRRGRARRALAEPYGDVAVHGGPIPHGSYLRER
jgi:hypothetical protein